KSRNSSLGSIPCLLQAGYIQLEYLDIPVLGQFCFFFGSAHCSRNIPSLFCKIPCAGFSQTRTCACDKDRLIHLVFSSLPQPHGHASPLRACNVTRSTMSRS